MAEVSSPSASSRFLYRSVLLTEDHLHRAVKSRRPAGLKIVR
jgi:hypothetical protein